MRQKALFKEEAIITERNGATISIGGKKYINFCSNDYLGLSQNKKLANETKNGLTNWGLGMASVRFISGTTSLHQELEKEISKFFRTEDALLYSSCFDANGGVFEVLLKEGDVVFSDELNHASIIDGIRLAKAEKFRYAHKDLADLESKLKGARNFRRKLIVTDGVFSMDSDIADLDKLSILAKKYQALLMVDDSHGSAVLGKNGRGSLEEKSVLGKIDILTSTFGKALGGAGGGFVAGKKEIISLLRQRSRPYLFSNSLTPLIVAPALYVLKNFEKEFLPLKNKLTENTEYFRNNLKKMRFILKGENHPIVPIMIFDEKKTVEMAKGLMQNGIYARGFTYPVVPQKQARIRIQISASHSKSDLNQALEVIEKNAKKIKIIQ